MRRFQCVVCGVWFQRVNQERCCDDYCLRTEKKRLERQSEVLSSMDKKSLDAHFRSIGGFRHRWKQRDASAALGHKKNKKVKPRFIKKQTTQKRIKPSQMSIEQMLLQSDSWKRMNAIAYSRALESLAKSKTIKIISPLRPKTFYESEAWLTLKKRALKIWGHKCMCCGVVDTIMHVDHIKARSKYPHLELDINNLQILCWKCNTAKGNHNEIDFRPKEKLYLLKTHNNCPLEN